MLRVEDSSIQSVEQLGVTRRTATVSFKEFPNPFGSDAFVGTRAAGGPPPLAEPDAEEKSKSPSVWALRAARLQQAVNGAPTSVLWAGCVLACLVLALYLTFRAAPLHAQFVERTPIRESELNVLRAGVHTGRVWPMDPPFVDVNTSVSEETVVGLLTLSYELLAGAPWYPAIPVCIFPAMYTLPWNILSVRDTNMSYVNPTIAGVGKPALVTTHASSCRPPEGSVPGVGEATRLSYMSPRVNVSYTAAYYTADGRVFSQVVGIPREKMVITVDDLKLSYCIQAYFP
jgi:hypothetical protein